jgi:hypothetical protein
VAVQCVDDLWNSARRFICRLFAVLAEEVTIPISPLLLVDRVVILFKGFGYLATVDSHPVSNQAAFVHHGKAEHSLQMKAPRLVFTSVPPEVQPRYFMIAFSLSRRTLTIIDAPEKLAILLGGALRATEPLPRVNQAATTPLVRPSDRWLAPGVYEVVTSESGLLL